MLQAQDKDDKKRIKGAASDVAMLASRVVLALIAGQAFKLANKSERPNFLA